MKFILVELGFNIIYTIYNNGSGGKAVDSGMKGPGWGKKKWNVFSLVLVGRFWTYEIYL